MLSEERGVRLAVLEPDGAPVAAAGVGIDGLRPVAHAGVDVFEVCAVMKCQERRKGRK